MKSAANTLVLVTNSRACRFDVGGGVWSTARPAGQAVAESVRAALSLGSGGARQVVVLSTELWTQTLSLNRGQVAGLSKSQLEQALVFEAEPFSGLPALDSVLGAVDGGARDGSASFWITQSTRAEREAVVRVLKESGHKFAGLGHPGGLPVPLGSVTTGSAWRRIECWDGAWLLVSCEDGRQTQVKVLPAAPSPRDLPTHGIVERLHARSSSSVFEEGAQNLADEATLRAWGAQALQVLTQRPEVLPLIAPQAAPPSVRGPVLMGGLLTTAVLLFSAAQAVFHGQRKQAASALLEEHGRIEPLIARAKQEHAKLQTDLAAVQKSQQSLESVVRQRAALPLLMDKLAELTQESLVVRGITAERGSMKLSGVTLEAAAVDELGILLTTALKPVGYLAQPVEKKARQAASNRGPWDFTLEVLPISVTRKTLAPVASDN